MFEYYHADRLHYAVAGTPNRLEYDQGFFVKQGDGAADFKPIAHLYKTQVYALAEYLERAGGDPRAAADHRHLLACRRRRRSSTSRLPYPEMDLCLWANDHGVPAREVGPPIGLTEEQVDRVYRDIEAKRRVSRYLHYVPTLDRAQRLTVCGIAGSIALRDETAAPGARGRSLRMVGALRASGPRRVRPLSRPARRARARPALDHRPRDRAAADVQRGRHALGRVQRRDLQLRRAARRARRRSAIGSGRTATPR